MEITHSNLGVLINPIQQKAYYKGIIVLFNTKNGLESFLLNPSTLLADAKSCLAILDNKMSKKLLTLMQNKVPFMLGIFADFKL